MQSPKKTEAVNGIGEVILKDRDQLDQLVLDSNEASTEAVLSKRFAGTITKMSKTTEAS